MTSTRVVAGGAESPVSDRDRMKLRAKDLDLDSPPIAGQPESRLESSERSE
jgi:hypothetical protein